MVSCDVSDWWVCTRSKHQSDSWRKRLSRCRSLYVIRLSQMFQQMWFITPPEGKLHTPWASLFWKSAHSTCDVSHLFTSPHAASLCIIQFTVDISTYSNFTIKSSPNYYTTRYKATWQFSRGTSLTWTDAKCHKSVCVLENQTCLTNFISNMQKIAFKHNKAAAWIRFISKLRNWTMVTQEPKSKGWNTSWERPATAPGPQATRAP